MKKFVALFFATCMVLVCSSCTKFCKCTYYKNGSVDTSTIKPFERELDKAYKDCSKMNDYNEATQTGAKCK